MFKTTKKVQVHFIGIGGIGMSALAEVLLQLGHAVSGSDVKSSSITLRLKSMGAQIFSGHHVDYLKGAHVCVYSSAVSSENPEYLEALRTGVPLIKRAEMLAELMRFKVGLAVAGTHGKTTTTSFLATILHEANLFPTHIIGGIVANLEGSNGRWGKGEYLVAEADESDGSFLLLSPVMAVVTNIDNDHLDHYGGVQQLKDSFFSFLQRIPFYGTCSLNLHDSSLRQLRARVQRPLVTFGLLQHPDLAGEVPDYAAHNIRYDSEGRSHFDLYYKGEMAVQDMMIQLPGEHNVLNALGAISLAHQCDLNFEEIAKGIKAFCGVGRRLERLYTNEGRRINIIDDYGHHPTEIKATIKTVRELYPQRRFVVLFEPHRYKRTKDCWGEFLHCFNLADEVFFFPIYPAGERPIEGINHVRLMDDINQLHPSLVSSMENLSEMNAFIEKIIAGGEETVVLTLGAGAIGKSIRDILGERR